MRELLRPFVDCRLCWLITFAVLAPILAVQAATLFPLGAAVRRKRRSKNCRPRPILVEPLLARAQATGERPPALAPVLGQHGVVGVPRDG